MLCTDNGTEYFSSILGDFLIKHGIIHHNSCVSTPQKNSISERKNRHLLEVARSLLFTSNVLTRFWEDVVLTACYLINQMPSHVLKFQTPLNCLYESYPDSWYSSNLDFKIFCCTSFVHNLDPNRSKLDPHSYKCIFLRYYRCYSPEKRKYFVSRDVTFFENQPFFTKNYLQGENMHATDIFWDSLKSSSSADSNSNLGLWEYFWEFSPDFHPTNSVNSESVSPIQICPDLSNSKFT